MSADPIVLALHAERVIAGLSQREVAKAAGVGQSMISEWESGVVVPTIASLRAWAAALGRVPILAPVEAAKDSGRGDL